jgi:deoxyribodipyrimidine photo-lyase
MRVAIWWVRRDLRLADSQALDTALRHGEAVIPVYVLDPVLLRSHFVGLKRLAFLFQGLRKLDRDLRARGSRLVVRRGGPFGELKSLKDESGAQDIYAERDLSPYARRRDQRVADHLPLHLTEDLTVHPPEAIRTRDGGAYRVFTPFNRTWGSLPPPSPADILQAPAHIPSPGETHTGVDLETLRASGETPFRPGKAEAQRLLRAFTQGKSGPITRYAAERDRLDLEGTSRLSPYLRFGMLSARQAACMIGKDYPAPIVDHAWARERALAAYARAREAKGGVKRQASGDSWQPGQAAASVDAQPRACSERGTGCALSPERRQDRGIGRWRMQGCR